MKNGPQDMSRFGVSKSGVSNRIEYLSTKFPKNVES